VTVSQAPPISRITQYIAAWQFANGKQRCRRNAAAAILDAVSKLE